ncbi:hypothetical protein AURDEDRAFT_157262 [Auricularia subglabra TFB-10046 SS5]|nr:hypothetical protein AURDEDRAFT_157262 [Auricularia subglabra TFB-10046 SS5]
MSSHLLFTFGSFGDITSLIQLTLAIRQALCNAATASEDITAAVSGIDSLILALKAIENLLRRNRGLPESITTEVASALKTCAQTLNQVERRIAGKKKEFEKARGSRAWRRYWITCAYVVLGGKAEIDALRQKLANQVTILQVFLSLLHSLDEIERRNLEARDKIADILNNISSLSTQVRSLSTHVQVPFQFFDHSGRAVDPILTLPWRNFLDFWIEHNFSVKATEIPYGELHRMFYASPQQDVKIWFELYIYQDPHSTGTPGSLALFSPIYYYTGFEGQTRISATLSGAFKASANWLAKTLESDRSTLVNDTLVTIFDRYGPREPNIKVWRTMEAHKVEGGGKIEYEYELQEVGDPGHSKIVSTATHAIYPQK